MQAGYLTDVVEIAAACGLPPCPRPAVVTLRLLVDGCESALPTCHLHAEWLREYAEEDDAVLLVDKVSEDSASA